jgi:hypothetical protein
VRCPPSEFCVSWITESFSSSSSLKKKETFENKIKGKEITFYLLGISINKPHPILHSTHFYWIKKKKGTWGRKLFKKKKRKKKERK